MTHHPDGIGKALSRPEHAAYWPPRALTADEAARVEAAADRVAALGDAIPGLAGHTTRARTRYIDRMEAALRDALDDADTGLWRRHLLVAILDRIPENRLPASPEPT